MGKMSRNFLLCVLLSMTSFFVYAAGDPSSASATSSRSKQTLEYYNLEKTTKEQEAQRSAAADVVQEQKAIESSTQKAANT